MGWVSPPAVAVLELICLEWGKEMDDIKSSTYEAKNKLSIRNKLRKRRGRTAIAARHKLNWIASTCRRTGLGGENRNQSNSSHS